MRPAKACSQCRVAKRGCYVAEGITACIACQDRQKDCSLLHAPVQKVKPTIAPSLARVVQEPSPSLSDLDGAVIAGLVSNYLNLIHDKSHSLFHIPTLWSSIRTGTISKSLLYSICAMGSRVPLAKEIHEHGRRFLAEAKALFLADFQNVHLENIQTAILIANLSAFELDTASEALYFGLAIRSALIISLQVEDSRDSPILKEIKFRTWWSLVMADRWVSSGMNLPFMISPSTLGPDLPMDEFDFQNLPEDFNGPLIKQPGLWALMLSLTEIFTCIQEMNRDMVDGKLSDNLTVVAALADRLQVWEGNLNVRDKFSSENLDFHCRRGNGGTFVALHLGFHHYSTLLYYHSLERNHCLGNCGNFKTYAMRCKSNASSYAAILRASRSTEGCRIMHITAGHMTVISSSVMLHTLLFGAESSAAAAREDLVSNFSVLVELQLHWPSLSKAIERLFTFQSACLWSTNMDAYKVDRWMLRFLMEYSLPLDRRAEDTDSETRNFTLGYNDALDNGLKNSVAERSLLIDAELQRLRS